MWGYSRCSVEDLRWCHKCFNVERQVAVYSMRSEVDVVKFVIKIIIWFQNKTFKLIPFSSVGNYYLSGDSSNINFCFMRKKAINTAGGFYVQLSRRTELIFFCPKQMFIPIKLTKLQRTRRVLIHCSFSVWLFRHDNLVMSISPRYAIMIVAFGAVLAATSLKTFHTIILSWKSFSNCPWIINHQIHLTILPRPTRKLRVEDH